jgi:hypothetical protein
VVTYPGSEGGIQPASSPGYLMSRVVNKNKTKEST